MPMGTAEVVIDLTSGRISDSGIAGPHSESVVIERSVHEELLGIHFKPGGAFPFLPFPFGELHNLSISMADVWGEGPTGELLGLLHEAEAVYAKFRVLDTWLLHAARRPLAHHPAVSLALNEFVVSPGLHSSGRLAERVNLSQRRFIELFRNEIGLTPKLFCRVQRFQQVLASIHKVNHVDWVDVALAFGYFDQSHFNHDFREFSGISPSEYLRCRTAHLNHIQVPE